MQAEKIYGFKDVYSYFGRVGEFAVMIAGLRIHAHSLPIDATRYYDPLYDNPRHPYCDMIREIERGIAPGLPKISADTFASVSFNANTQGLPGAIANARDLVAAGFVEPIRLGITFEQLNTLTADLESTAQVDTQGESVVAVQFPEVAQIRPYSPLATDARISHPA